MDESLPLKRCVTCHVSRPLVDFNRRTRAADGLQERCRPCSRQWYEDNKAQHMVNTRARTVRQRAQLMEYLHAFLLENPCIDCGEADLRVLEFDHRDPTTKARSVAAMFADAYPWKTIQAEIAKCDVRYANCHRRRTSGDFSWWRTPAETARQEAVALISRAPLTALFPSRGRVHPVG